MRITVRGWGRDLGETEIMNAALEEAEASLGPDNRFHRGKTYLRVDSDYINEVRVSTCAELRLGGSYLLHVELNKEEIAQLFYATHEGDIVRMFRSFVQNERARELAEYVERRRQRLAKQRLAQEEQASQN
jgi:hypothetical protein